MDEARSEYDQIINRAREEADKKVEESKKGASEIRADVAKEEKIIKRIVSDITGAESR